MLDFTQIAHHQHHRAGKLLHKSHKLSTSALGAVGNCAAGGVQPWCERVQLPGGSGCNCEAAMVHFYK